MKRLIIITGIIVSGLLSSCSDYFEAPAESSLDEAVIFSTPSLAKGAVDGIKEPMGLDQSYRNRFLMYYGLNSDVEWYQNSQTPRAESELCTYNTGPSNTVMNTDKNVWTHMYTSIERANLCIRGLRTYGDSTPGTELAHLLGEALTLRAVFYADLIKAWGDVPARFEPLNTANTYVPKSNRDIIYKQIISDLGEAAILVPWPNDIEGTKSTERVNKAFVKGLRARLALVASGFQQYPDGGGFGVVRRSTDPDLSVDKMYTLALKECRDVINSGKARLQTTITGGAKVKSPFEQLWRSYNEEITAAGGESLWEIPFAYNRGRIAYQLGVKHDSKNQFNGYNGATGATSGPLPHIFYDYVESDTRRDVTCVPYKYGPAVSGIAKQTLGKLNTWYFGKYRYEWMSRVVALQDDGLNIIYMRYAEVLLMAAEAANEIEGYEAAKPYLKEIRNRAFKVADRPTNVEAYVDALNSKQAMFDAIVDEHKFEFTGEMLRKQALIRWGENTLKDKLDEAKARMKALQERSGDYATVPTKLYTKFQSDNVSIDVWGLNRGETIDNLPTGFSTTAVSWTWSIDGEDAVANNDKRESLYRKDPKTRQFWPIWEVFINGSNSTLKNDYNY